MLVVLVVLVFVIVVVEVLVVFVLIVFVDIGRVQPRQVIGVRGHLVPLRGRVELGPLLLVAEVNGKHSAVQELEAVIVAVVLGLGLPAETHLERHGGQFCMTRRPSDGYLRCLRTLTDPMRANLAPMTTVGQTDEKPTGRTLFGHPIGLTNLFGVELWERFSFYGMLTILGYYLYYSVTDGGLELPKTTATGIVGAYGGLVYLSTVLGGWIADRVLGMERTVFYGGVVVMFGHIALAILPGLTGVGVGLVLVALGSGALKANASSLLGTLYEKGDPRCDGGFTLFYLGINLGAFIGPLITGLLQTRIGFHWGFGAAAVGMALGLAQYVFFRQQPRRPRPRRAEPVAAQRSQDGRHSSSRSRSSSSS